MLSQWQNRQGTSIVETFKRGVVVARGVLNPKRNHGATKIVHVHGDAHLLARGRETRVRRHNQSCVEFLSIGKGHTCILRFAIDRLHFLLGEPRDIRLVFNLRVNRLANVVVGNQITQGIGRFAARCFGGCKMQLKWRRAIDHFG